MHSSSYTTHHTTNHTTHHTTVRKVERLTLRVGSWESLTAQGAGGDCHRTECFILWGRELWVLCLNSLQKVELGLSESSNTYMNLGSPESNRACIVGVPCQWASWHPAVHIVNSLRANVRMHESLQRPEVRSVHNELVRNCAQV